MISLVKPYFVTKLKALGVNHWDSVRFDNIPENKLPAFHVELGNFTGGKGEQASLQVTCPVTVRVFFKGSNSQSAIDKAAVFFDSALPSVLAAESRLNITGVKDITYKSGETSAMSADNDKDAKLEMNFQALVMYVT